MPFDGVDERSRRTLAARMRAVFGPNGEHWCQMSFFNGAGYCWLGARDLVCGVAEMRERDLDRKSAIAVFGHQRAAWGSIMEWNDSPRRTFKDIAEALDRLEALELADCDVLSRPGDR